MSDSAYVTAYIQSEQPTPFRPFMWQLIMLTQITCRTRQDNIINIVARTLLNATQRDGMLQVENVLSILLLKLSMITSTIVASVLLCFQLLLDLLFSKNTRNSFLSCSTIVIIGFVFIWIVFTICTQPLLILFSMRVSIGFLPNRIVLTKHLMISLTFDTSTQLTSRLHSITMSFAHMKVFTRSRQNPFTFNTSFMSHFNNFNFSSAWRGNTFFTPRKQTIGTVSVRMKEFRCGRVPILTLGTPFFPQSIFSNYAVTLIAFAYLTTGMKAILLSAVFVKVDVCCGEKFFTFGTLLERGCIGYSVAHGRSPRSFITPEGMSSTALATIFLNTSIISQNNL